MADWFDENGITKPQAQKQTAPPTSSSQGDWFDENGITTSPNIAHPENLSIQPNPETATLQDRFRHYVGQYIPGVLKALGMGAGAGIGGLEGGVGAIPGAAMGGAAGSEAGISLQKYSPRTFGAPPESELGQVAQDAAVGAGTEGLGALGSKLINPKINLLASPLLRNTKPIQGALAGDVIKGATKTLDKNLFPQAAVIETAAQNAQDHYNSLPPPITHPGQLRQLPPSYISPSQSLIEPNEEIQAFKYHPPITEVDSRISPGSPYSEGTIGNKLLTIPAEQTDARIQSLRDINKTFMSDVTQVRNLKFVPGGADAAEQLGMSNLLQKGYTPSNGNIDPDNIIKELDGKNSDIYSEALRPQTKKNVIDLMTTIKQAQEQQKNNPAWTGTVNYVKHRLVFDATMLTGGALAGGLTGHEAGGLGVAGGIVLGDMAINKLMSNPVTAKAVVAAIKTPSSASVSPMLGKIIANGLRGSYVLYQGPEDKLEKAYVDDKGQLTYQKPGQ